MTGIYKVQRKHGIKWYAKVNYTIAGNHYQKKSVDAARFLGHKNAFVTANTYAHSPQTHKAAIADSVSKRMQRMAA